MDDRHELPPANAKPPYPETSGATDYDMRAAGVAPPPVGVYDRPEHTGRRTNSIVIGVVAVIVLILLAILLVMFIL